MTAPSSDDAILRHADGSIDIAFYARRARRLRSLAVAGAEDRCIAGTRSIAACAAGLVYRYLMAAARAQPR